MKISKISITILLICFLDSKELLEKENVQQNITIDDFNVNISENNCSIVIESLVKLFEEGYIYTDIKKNPPNKDYFGATDIIEELKNIPIENRKYYDFFRDIKRILGKIKDGHLAILAYKSPNNYNLQRMVMCLPFSFHIKGENRSDAKIYIKKFERCLNYYDKEIQNFVNDYEGKYLKEINGTDPFDYIQNLTKEFNSFYNIHSTFTHNIHEAHQIFISSNPLTQKQFSNISFVFDDEKNLTLDYYLYYIPERNDNEDFNKFYNKEISKKYKTVGQSILDIENKYNKIKNNVNNKVNLRNWNYSTEDGGIKCRVDTNNKLNVFVQDSFFFIEEDYIKAIQVIEKCTEMFYNNDYQIVGIETNNDGGVVKLGYYFQELLQVKILPTFHLSTLKSELMKNYVEADIEIINIDPDMYQRIDIETCEPFKKFDDMKEIEDDYGDNVKHKKTQYFGVFNSSDLKKHKKIREKYYELNKLKRPTDIIIFTDTYSFSATSFFIKVLQETGGAITVGYFGNPKSNETMDASQSPSFVGTFENSDISKKLREIGFEIKGVTIYESYNYSYQGKNPIPREYLINPVDEKFDIFESYNDDLYNKFMEKAKEIFKKYNEDNKCNPNNLNLLYDPNNKKECYTFENDEHAHGGYECNSTTGNWTNICKPYYCDIDYYFDKFKNKCVKDICTENKEDEGDKSEGKNIFFNQLIYIFYLLCLIW